MSDYVPFDQQDFANWQPELQDMEGFEPFFDPAWLVPEPQPMEYPVLEGPG
jgi:hypothetical protein